MNDGIYIACIFVFIFGFSIGFIVGVVTMAPATKPEVRRKLHVIRGGKRK